MVRTSLPYSMTARARLPWRRAADKRLNEVLLSRCRAVRIESPGQPERIIAGARAAAAEAFCARTLDGLPEAVATRLEALVDDHDIDAPEGGEVVELSLQHARESGRRFASFVDEMFWPEMEVRLYLKAASRVVSMTTTDDAVLQRAPHRTIYSLS